MDKVADVGEIVHSNSLGTDVICVEDDFYSDNYGCQSCIFDGKNYDCIADLFTDKFECRSNKRPDKKDVHFVAYEQNK